MRILRKIINNNNGNGPKDNGSNPKNNGNAPYHDIGIKIGDYVKVKEGIMCPDMEDLDIGGWQGVIIEINDDMVCIEWDDNTIESMPRNFIEQSEDEGLEHKLMYLYISEVEKINT